jgi:hypothetical protein
VWLVLIAGPAVTGCAATAGKASPAEYGIDLRFSPGFAVNERTSVHPTAAYAHSFLGGVTGQSAKYLYLGGQVRHAPWATQPGGSNAWFGGEAMIARRRTSFDTPGIPTSSVNGWVLSGLAGYRLWEPADGGSVHAYAALGVTRYGGSGVYARVGQAWQPAVLQR